MATTSSRGEHAHPILVPGGEVDRPGRAAVVPEHRRGILECAEQAPRARHPALADLHDPDAVTLPVEQHDPSPSPAPPLELRLGKSARQRDRSGLDHLHRSELLECGDPGCERGLFRGEDEVIVAAYGGHQLLGSHGKESLWFESQDVALLRLTERGQLHLLDEEKG